MNGNPDSQLEHIVSLWFENVSAEQLLMSLDLSGIAVSSGSACTAGNIDPSHVLIAMYGEKSPIIAETIRISFGLGTTSEQINYLAEQLIKVSSRLKK